MRFPAEIREFRTAIRPLYGVYRSHTCTHTRAIDSGRAHSNGKLEAIREAAKQFQLGLQAGAQLAKGFMPRFAEDDAASDDQ